MASNTLLASDLARRNKEIQSGREARNQSPSVNISSGGDNKLGKNDENESDSWKMIFYQSTQPQNTGCGEQLDQNRITLGNDKVLSLPMAEKSLAKIDRVTSIDQQQMNDSAKIGTHVSDPSSLVTSLGSSREGSPDKANLALPFTMPPSASWLFTNPAGAVTTWLPSVQLRHGAAMAQMPLFAAWADS
ncbi:hypothetical protein Droror1_Dr00010819 [Drosera rotundifolia]